MDKDNVPKESSNDEKDYINYEAELEKHGSMLKLGYVRHFLFEYSNEKSMDETTQTFLKQVRESSGYEVDCKPNPGYYESPFVPYRLDVYKGDDAKRLAEEAIKSINWHVEDKGERYELVKIERYVRVRGMPKLLTLLVKDCNGSERRLRACMMRYCQPKFSCYLHEWKDVTEGGEGKGWRVVKEEDKEWRAKAEKEEEAKDSSIALDKGLKDGDDMPKVEEVKDWSMKDGDVGMEVEKGSIEEDQRYDTELESIEKMERERKRLKLEDDYEVK